MIGYRAPQDGPKLEALSPEDVKRWAQSMRTNPVLMSILNDEFHAAQTQLTQALATEDIQKIGTTAIIVNAKLSLLQHIQNYADR